MEIERYAHQRPKAKHRRVEADNIDKGMHDDETRHSFVSLMK